MQALSQFVAWPGLLVFQDKAKLLYDGAELNYPPSTAWSCDATTRPHIPRCSTRSCRRSSTPPTSSTRIRWRRPNRRRGQRAAAGGGLPLQRSRRHVVRHHAEAVAGRRAERRCAVPEVDRRLRRPRRRRTSSRTARCARRSRPASSTTTRRSRGHPPIAGTDPVATPVTTLAGSGSRRRTQPAANPTLPAARPSATRPRRGAKVRAAYVPDAELGTRWFADKAAWVHDGQNYLPFGTTAGAQRYLARAPGQRASRLSAGIGRCGMTAST